MTNQGKLPFKTLNKANIINIAYFLFKIFKSLKTFLNQNSKHLIETLTDSFQLKLFYEILCHRFID